MPRKLLHGMQHPAAEPLIHPHPFLNGATHKGDKHHAVSDIVMLPAGYHSHAAAGWSDMPAQLLADGGQPWLTLSLQAPECCPAPWRVRPGPLLTLCSSLRGSAKPLMMLPRISSSSAMPLWRSVSKMKR